MSAVGCDQPKIGIGRQMVRGNSRASAGMDLHGVQTQRGIMIDPVQRKDRKRARMGAHFLSPSERVAELCAQQAGGPPVKPLIEITEQQSRSSQLAWIQNVREHLRLSDPLA